jgi:phosphoribosyl-ATP pyrophosphohydrolase
MIIPSIDCMGGQAVQLIGGKELAIEAGDPRPIADKFSLAGSVALIDLDAALGQGSNAALIKDCLPKGSMRVGGGIRSIESAIEWLDAGADQVIIGSKATPEFLSQLPRERVTAAVDAVHGEVVIQGWTSKTGRNFLEMIRELRDHVSGFLVTFVEREGRMQGLDFDQVKEVVEAAGSARVTIAGGITTPEDIRVLDQLGADAQVGMALYSGKLSLAQGIAAPLKSDRPDGLWPTVVADLSGVALGLCYSNQESLEAAIEESRGIYWSRKRGLWRKGETSGASQKLHKVDLDCDRDCLRFTVSQAGAGFCHLDNYTCWGEGQGLGKLTQILEDRKETAPEGSYTKRLFNDRTLLNSKIVEEARELAEAESREEIVWEAADVLYFALTKLAAENIPLTEVESELNQRRKKISRRGGDAKPSSKQ